MNKKSQIEDTIQNIRYDLKAEVVLADLIENGFEKDDFIIIPNGTFRRRYSRDIAYTSLLKLPNGQVPVGIYINRDAIYDTLPEGFFHEKTESKENEPLKASNSSKKLKAEEKAARNFFLPFENELFIQKINLELEERKILSHFSENILDDIAPDFWSFDNVAERIYLSRMAKFLHLSYKIAGNLQLTGKCLGAILNEDVNVSREERCMIIKENKSNEKNSYCSLGSASLGVDFICGDSFNIKSNFLHFTIGPLKNTNVSDYLENGKISNFIDCFCRFFVPAEQDVLTSIFVKPGDYNFTLNSSEDSPVLGYTTLIESKSPCLYDD
jgi:hypothetical protein